MIKSILKNIYHLIGKRFPTFFYLIQHKRAAKRLGNSTSQRSALFDEFIASCSNKKCLQIGVKDSVGAKYGNHWVSIDKYDTRDFIDYQYDIHDLPFKDSSFDAVVCISILEHIPRPQQAIAELHRVLKPGGKIWVQMPFQFPYHEAPKDYWRASPEGLKIWLESFNEIASGSSFWAGTPLITASYYFGEKQSKNRL